jgi:hypothetical protein
MKNKSLNMYNPPGMTLNSSKGFGDTFSSGQSNFSPLLLGDI